MIVPVTSALVPLADVGHAGPSIPSAATVYHYSHHFSGAGAVVAVVVAVIVFGVGAVLVFRQGMRWWR